MMLHMCNHVMADLADIAKYLGAGTQIILDWETNNRIRYYFNQTESSKKIPIQEIGNSKNPSNDEAIVGVPTLKSAQLSLNSWRLDIVIGFLCLGTSSPPS